MMKDIVHVCFSSWMCGCCIWRGYGVDKMGKVWLGVGKERARRGRGGREVAWERSADLIPEDE